MVASVDEGNQIPVIVTMRVKCHRYGHAEDEAYEFDMRVEKVRPRQFTGAELERLCR